MPYLRDILNHYILNSVVTFEMVELSLENRKTWFTQFSDTGRYQLFVAEEAEEVIGYAASLRFHQRPAYAPSVMSSIYLHPEHTGKGIGEKIYSELIENLKKPRMFTEYMVLWFYQTPVPRDFTKNWAFRSPGYSMRVATNLEVSRCPYVRTSSRKITLF